MYRIGDKVVCIDNSGYGANHLILGKVYEIVSVDINNDIFILLRIDDLYNYHYKRFISLKEYRKRKLNRIYERNI